MSFIPWNLHLSLYTDSTCVHPKNDNFVIKEVQIKSCQTSLGAGASAECRRSCMQPILWHFCFVNRETSPDFELFPELITELTKNSWAAGAEQGLKMLWPQAPNGLCLWWKNTSVWSQVWDSAGQDRDLCLSNLSHVRQFVAINLQSSCS